MKGQKILLIDDERNIRMTVRTALETDGFQVAEATSAERALASLRREPFDLAILDLWLGEQSGMQILAEMRARGVQTPTLILTAHGRVRDAVHAIRLGAIDFLQKPVDPVTLRTTVSDILERREARTEHAEPDSLQDLVREAKRLINLQHFDLAGRKVTEALKIDEELPDAHNLQGILHEVAGDYAAARDAYWRALELDPHHAAARGNMRRFAELHSIGHSDEPLRYDPTLDDGPCHEGLAENNFPTYEKIPNHYETLAMAGLHGTAGCACRVRLPEGPCARFRSPSSEPARHRRRSRQWFPVGQCLAERT